MKRSFLLPLAPKEGISTATGFQFTSKCVETPLKGLGVRKEIESHS